MIIWKILLPILVISVMVMIHEFGHFIVAKLNGVKVHEFALGMGPKIFGTQKGETLYALRLFPIGGFVRMEGEDELSDDPRAFNKKKPLQKIAIIFAGPFMNFLLAFLIYMVAANMVDVQVPYVQKTLANFPAQSVGLKNGDKILKINNDKISLQDEIQYETNFVSKGKPISITVKRGEKEIRFKLTPKKESGTYLIGFTAQMKRLNFIESVGYAFDKTAFMTKFSLVSVKYLIQGKVSTKDVSGPIGIGVVTNKVAKSSGFYGIIMLTALLSISLGFMNLLPIPALDGSRILFIFFELLRGKPVDQEKEAMVHFVGYVLLMLLTVFITYSDIVKFFK